MTKIIIKTAYSLRISVYMNKINGENWSKQILMAGWDMILQPWLNSVNSEPLRNPCNTAMMQNAQTLWLNPTTYRITQPTVDVKSLAPLFIMSRVIKLDNINLIRIYTWIVQNKYYLYIPV